MAELVIEVERRSSAGKGANRKLRRQGLIPAVVYGGGKESVPVVIDRHAVTELLRQEKGRNTVFLLKMKGTKQERHAMVRDAQIDPITRQYVHLDFIRVIKGQRLKVEVPIVLEGEAEGVKVGGFLDWVGRTLHVECPAEDIPQAFRVEISHLQLSQHLTAADIPLLEGVRL
ncbi:MAG: 50S ribosomal protein L25, partial [Terriglobales bacterium]